MHDHHSIDVENSINSGQVFLWRKIGSYWYGINGQDILRVDGTGGLTSYQNIRTDFFRKRDDMKRIIRSISRDGTVKSAIRRYPGLRILEQDPFQCLISFIVSANSNIQKIRNSLENLSKKFGESAEFEDMEFFLFPDPEKLAKASIKEIRGCGVGYRAGFIKEAATKVDTGEVDFEYLRGCDYGRAKEEICQVAGVGNKVADCVLLFSLDKLEAFPLDRWMIRILERYYSDRFQPHTKTLTDRQYGILSQRMADHFGPYAGYAQQFLFKMEREKHEKKWL